MARVTIPTTLPSELHLQRQPTDWRRWNKTRLHLDDGAYDAHADADEDEADGDDDGEDPLSLHLSE